MNEHLLINSPRYADCKLPRGISIAAAPTATVARTPTVVRGAAAPTVEIYATGFNNPRGLKFGPDGALYVAEGGAGGTASTVGKCEQVPADLGPYTGAARGGRITRVDGNGNKTTVTDRFPSSATSATTGHLTSGPADMAWIGSTMYVVTAGSGCSHGVINTVNGVYRIGGNGNPVLVADLSTFQKAHPVANPEPDDFEPDGTWWSMNAVGQMLYAVEPNHGEIDKISTTGAISRVADISASQGHIVPTASAYRTALSTSATLNTFPIVPGSSKILRITPRGSVSDAATGFTTVARPDLRQARPHVCAREHDHCLAARPPGEEISSASPAREARGSRQRPFASDRMTFGPDGALYVSNLGFGLPAVRTARDRCSASGSERTRRGARTLRTASPRHVQLHVGRYAVEPEVRAGVELQSLLRR